MFAKLRILKKMCFCYLITHFNVLLIFISRAKTRRRKQNSLLLHYFLLQNILQMRIILLLMIWFVTQVCYIVTNLFIICTWIFYLLNNVLIFEYCCRHN